MIWEVLCIKNIPLIFPWFLVEAEVGSSCIMVNHIFSKVWGVNWFFPFFIPHHQYIFTIDCQWEMIIEKILVFWLTVTFNEADDKVRTSVHCRQLVESTSTSCVNFTSPNYCFLSDPQSQTKFAKIHKLGQGNGHFLALKNWPNIYGSLRGLRTPKNSNYSWTTTTTRLHNNRDSMKIAAGQNRYRGRCSSDIGNRRFIYQEVCCLLTSRPQLEGSALSAQAAASGSDLSER